jgi:hypothetical protein
MDDRLARLLAELLTIKLWDEDYHQKKSHSESDDISYRARQEMRQEIVREMANLANLSNPPKAD